MSELSVVTDQSFQKEVLQSKTPVLVEFGAVWCGPCKTLEPVVKNLADEWGVKARVVKMDVDQNPDVTMRYQVMGLPTLILFKAGQPVERTSGYQPKDRLLGKFASHL
jgi:thioredoxin 1